MTLNQNAQRPVTPSTHGTFATFAPHHLQLAPGTLATKSCSPLEVFLVSCFVTGATDPHRINAYGSFTRPGRAAQRRVSHPGCSQSLPREAPPPPLHLKSRADADSGPERRDVGARRFAEQKQFRHNEAGTGSWDPGARSDGRHKGQFLSPSKRDWENWKRPGFPRITR